MRPLNFCNFHVFSSFSLFCKRIDMLGNLIVPVTLVTALFAIILQLLVIELSIRYFAATCKAMDAESNVSSNSADVRLRPQVLNKTWKLTIFFNKWQHAIFIRQNLASSLIFKNGNSTITAISFYSVTIFSKPLNFLLSTII